jgi:hypothetical protein
MNGKELLERLQSMDEEDLYLPIKFIKYYPRGGYDETRIDYASIYRSSDDNDKEGESYIQLSTESN